jgi:hypothetical protein
MTRLSSTHDPLFGALMSLALVTACGGCDDVDDGDSSPHESDHSTSTSDPSSSATSVGGTSTGDASIGDSSTGGTSTGDTSVDDPSTGSTGETGDDGRTVEPEGTNVLLHVVDAQGAPIGPATITVAGATSFTDAAGFILFDDLPDGRFTARVDAGGYNSNVVALDVGAGSSTYKEVELFPLGPALPFDADLGGELEIDGTSVEIPPYVLVDRNGEPVAGMVEATITSIDPTDTTIAGTIGTLEGIDENGDDVGLLSVTMAEISLWQAGQPLQLAPGALARIELDVPAELAAVHQPGDEIPAWWLDLDAGIWREEGMGTIEVDEDDPTQLVWAANVGHFTRWNADRYRLSEECFVISLVDQFGNFIPNQYFQTTSIGAGFAWDNGTSLASNLNLVSNCVVMPIGSEVTVQIPSFGATQVLPPGPGVAGSCFTGSCTPVTVVLEVAPPVICTPGSSQTCAYMGDPMTLDVGICQAGSDYCIDGGTVWSGCQGEVLPEPETCATIFDDDCDGQVNESGGLDCTCGPGDTQACYSGPLGTQDVGECTGGTRSCDVFFGQYGPCVGQITPTAEDCMTPEDESCNGISSCEGAGQWVTGFGNGASTQGRDIAVNGFGEVYTVGAFDGSVDFGGGVLVSAGGTDIFLVKQDSSGAHVWSKAIGGASSDQGLSIDLDGSGNPLIVGTFADTVDVDGVSVLVSAGGSDVFVAKFDANGLHQWSTSFGGASYDGGFGVAANAAGDVFVTGTSSGDVFMGAPGVGVSDAFVVALAPGNGALTWAQVRGGGTAVGLGLDVAPDGSLVTTGYFSQTIDFGGGALVSAGDFDVFVAKLDQVDGSHVWSDRFGNTVADAGTAVAVDPATGVVYLTGRFLGAVDFGGGALANVGGRDAFVLALDTNGMHQWSRGWGGLLDADGLGIAAGPGGPVVTGRFVGTVDFGGGPVDSAGSYDIMLVKLDAGGGYEWAQRFGGASDDSGIAVAADSVDVYLTGSFQGDVDFGTGVLTNPSGADVVIARYSP